MEYIDVTKIMQAFLTHVNSNRNLSFLFGAGISIDYVPAIDDITLNVEKNLIASGRKKEIKAWGLLKVEANDKKMDFSIELVFSLLSNKLIAVGREVLLEMTYTELENFQKHLITLFNTEICKNIKPDKDGLFDSIIDTSPHLRFAEWVSQRNTSKGLEIFTPNYDYLLELSLESQKIRYFDGFSGGFIPYFDVGSIENLDYRTSDIKLWKIHGSLGWCNQKGNIVKSSLDKNKIMILPSALKYDETKKVPYAILLDRLAASLRSNETTLIICGYSFGDDHINDLIINSLRSNRNAQVFAFVYDEQILKKGEKCNINGLKNCTNKYSVVKGSHYETICKKSSQITIMGFRTVISKGEVYAIKMANYPELPNDDVPYFAYDTEVDSSTKNKVCNGFGKLKICDFKEMTIFLKKMVGDLDVK